MKLLFIILTITTLLLADVQMGLKGGSCTLAQKGQVTMNYNTNIYTDVAYSANKKSGKNFREIFVGSSMNVGKKIQLKILDYKPNKRIKGKPKTGIFMANVTRENKSTTIQMAYIFDKGIMSATGIVNETTVGFFTRVDYSFCTVSRK